VFKGGEKPLFLIGEVTDKALNSFDIKKDFLTSPIIYFEFYFRNISSPAKKYSAPPTVPASLRDLSIVIKEDVRFTEVEKKILSLGVETLEKAVLIDLYRGAQVEKGKKSMSFRLFFRGRETLIHSDIDAQLDRILKALAEAFGAELRQK